MYDMLLVSYKMGGDIVETSDTEVDPETSYVRYAYQIAVPGDTTSPSTSKWYEKIDGSYVLTDDFEPVEGKEYYEYVLVDVVPDGDEDPSSLGWCEVVEENEYSNLSSTMTVLTDVDEEVVVVDEVD